MRNEFKPDVSSLPLFLPSKGRHGFSHQKTIEIFVAKFVLRVDEMKFSTFPRPEGNKLLQILAQANVILRDKQENQKKKKNKGFLR